MKHVTLLLLVLLFATPAFGQKKKKDKGQSAQTSTTDSVATDAFAGDTLLTDPAVTELALYRSMYDTLVAKVFKYDFDPARTSVLIDSLVLKRESSFAGLNATQASLLDTIAVLQDENLALQTELDRLNADAEARTDRTVVIMELKQWKALLDDQVITLTEYNALKKELLDKLSGVE